jgi:NAD(P)H-hydrate epimerase
VLKGSGSLIGQREQAVALCSNGHAGMATAGAGDVLSGFIAALLAQDMAPLEAAKSAVLLHALAADGYADTAAAETLVASDLIHGLGPVWRHLRGLQSGAAQ